MNITQDGNTIYHTIISLNTLQKCVLHFFIIVFGEGFTSWSNCSSTFRYYNDFVNARTRS